MKKKLQLIIVFSTLLLQFATAQNEKYWVATSKESVAGNESRYAYPEKFQSVSVDLLKLQAKLAAAPKENSAAAKSVSGRLTLDIPMPDGSSQRFSIVEYSMMEPGLAAQYPDFKTYSGQGIDDPTATIKISSTRFGFHSMILSSKGSFFIDPYDQNNKRDYIIYDKKDFKSRTFTCETEHDLKEVEKYRNLSNSSALRTHGTQLRNYRLCVAANGEYTAFHGGSVASAMAAVVTSVNRVNGVYENEVAVRLTLIANNSLVVYTNGATDPYTNGNGVTMLTENTNNLNTVIGTANYDVGHVFSTGGGGVATLNGPCGTNKARGVTGSSSPVNDAFDIDYVAHEMGHQFGANHTFNASTGSCSGNRAASAAYEPGSGITIMAYAGICTATNDLAPNSIAYFHTKSFDEITTFITTAATGGSCPVTTNTGNTPPSGNVGADYSIPISTPFILTGSATDADNDPLVYSWEEYDLGSAGNWNAAQSSANDAPLFRPFPPVTSPSRTFPKLSDIINNTTTIGEILPTVARTLDFRLTVRDNRIGGGGVWHNDVTQKVTTVATAGPFLVTSPNTAVSWGTGTSQTITWNVASTDLAPISCANVNILLSIDGGNTFPITLAASTPNDGSQSVVIPANITTQARVKIEAVGNIFFDMSNVNFTIVAASPVLTTLTTNPLGVSNLCAGSNVSISYSGDGPANAGNIFTAQLSDINGLFGSPVVIGTLTATGSGTISCTIPAGATAGTNYRIRVVSSNPAIIGSNNGSNLSIFQSVGSAGTITGSNVVCQGQNSVAYSVPLIANATTYNWTLPTGGTIASGAGTNSITVNYSAAATSGNVSVSGSNAGCGNGASSSRAITVNNLPATPGPISGNSNPCSGLGGYIYSVPAVAGATSYNWTLPSGATITAGNNTNSITVSFSTLAVPGNITVSATNACGTGTTSSPFSFVLSPQPTPAVISYSGNSVVCAPGVVNLSFTPTAGHQYQWMKNGIATGAADTLSTYTATTSGDFSVVSTIIPGGSLTFNSSGTVSILDNSCSTPSSNINVAGYSTTIPSSQISITINITHTWLGDLVLILEAPNGNRLALANRLNNGGYSEDNFINTTFTDAAAGVLPPTTGAPYTGSYKPVGTIFTVCTNVTTNVTSFAGFGGGSINPNGQWRLRVFDQAGTDVGTVNNWSITFPAFASNCTSESNIITTLIQPTPDVTSFSPSSGSVGDSIAIRGTGFEDATALHFNFITANFEIKSDTLIYAIVPPAATSGYITVFNTCGSDVSSNIFDVINFATLNVNLFIEGYYNLGGTMTNTISGSADTITVKLINSVSQLEEYSVNGILSSNGTANITFPSAAIGNSYYIIIKQRNTIETWSKNPITFSSSNSYNFKN